GAHRSTCGLPLKILRARAAIMLWPWAGTRRSVWIPPKVRADGLEAPEARRPAALRIVSAARRRRRDRVCAGAVAATQPCGCEVAKWLLLLIVASTCKRNRVCGTAARRSRMAHYRGTTFERPLASIGGETRQPYC